MADVAIRKAAPDTAPAWLLAVGVESLDAFPRMPEIIVESADGAKARFSLEKPATCIGRSRDSDIFLPDQWLSRHHAEIRATPEGHVLVDLGSKNGTLLNGARLSQAQPLSDGDVITLGEHKLSYRTQRQVEEPVEEPEPLGTRVFSARELSDLRRRPATDAVELARQNRVLTVLSEAARDLLAHRPLPELFERILGMLFDAVPAERGAILLLEGDPPQPSIKASRSRQGASIVKVSASIARRVIADRVSLLLPNLMDDIAFRAQESILTSGIRSAVCAPLLYSAAGKTDEVIGLVYLDSLKGSHTFSEDDARVVTALANVAAAKIENARLLEEILEKRRLEADMQVAAEIQRSLLPTGAPRLPGWDLVGSNRPCRTVGGDYYDFASHGDRLLLALGDVSGKGTGAALLMCVLRAVVRAHWQEPALAEAMARINSAMCENVPEGKYVTFFLAHLNPTTGQLAYVNAGHNPPLLMRADGTVEMLEEGGMVLGMFDSFPYADGQARLMPGDMLMVFSDGVTETFSPDDREFGEQGLLEVATRSRRLAASDLQAEILRALDAFSGGARATDDRTLIVLKRD